MARRDLFLISSVLLASLAYLLSSINFYGQQKPREYIQGRNATVLFMTNAEHGLSNVHLATTQSLLEHYPDIDIHYASFAGPLQGKLERMVSFLRLRQAQTRDVTFHELPGKAFMEAGGYLNDNVSTAMISPPGMPGISQLMTVIDSINGWTINEHLEIYRHMAKVIEEIDPTVVVLDTLLAPAVDAVREANRAHIFISPNTLAENFAPLQPYAKGFWKYPALGTGFSYPLPWRNIPENLYVTYRIIKQFLWSSRLSELRQAGIQNPSSLITMHREDVPWITMNTEGAALPVEFVPVNVTGVGPIVLSSAPASEQDEELVAWASRADTILINLGSFFKYPRDWAIPMVNAVAGLLDQTGGRVQVLWKFNTRGEVPDDLMTRLEPHIKSGRLRLSKWLTVEPISLLESGAIAISVHHGGSNCYHEAVRAGIPQIILPLWADLYSFATLVEVMGIGIWPCRKTAPNWTTNGLLNAMSTILGGKSGAEIKRRARELGEEVRAREPGRDLAAREVAKLAYLS